MKREEKSPEQPQKGSAVLGAGRAAELPWTAGRDRDSSGAFPKDRDREGQGRTRAQSAGTLRFKRVYPRWGTGEKPQVLQLLGMGRGDRSEWCCCEGRAGMGRSVQVHLRCQDQRCGCGLLQQRCSLSPRPLKTPENHSENH